MSAIKIKPQERREFAAENIKLFPKGGLSPQKLQSQYKHHKNWEVSIAACRGDLVDLAHCGKAMGMAINGNAMRWYPRKENEGETTDANSTPS